MEDSPVHLVALVDGIDHVCCRYRLAAFRPFLERAGHTLELRPWPGTWRAWTFGGSLARADAVILQRRLIPQWLLFLLRRQARRLIYDFDDAVFLRDSYSAKGPHSRRRVARFRAIVSAADAVFAGNRFLAGQAIRHGAALDAVHVIPTCVDPAGYVPAHADRAEVALAWIGSSSTLQGLEQVRPLLETLGQRVPNLRLKLICDRFLELRHLPVQRCPWSAATEAADLCAADIGVAWVPDDLWSQGKCGLKVLQYLAAGLPVVANPVGVHTDMVGAGNGFLASSTMEWCTAIGRLAGDAALRRRLGQAGRRLLETEYSVAVGADHWLTLLDQLRNRRAA
jgi:glycosyltransferase involved in cell wall biosynthesis